MNTLIRNATRSLNGGFDGYEPLDQSEEDKHGRRELSHNVVQYSLSYKHDRAKKRQIFLKSYKLAPLETLGRSSRPGKLKKMVVKVKKVVVSVVSFMRIGSLRPCSNCRLSIYTSSPMPRRKCC
jgi:hypothetical protein